MTAFDYVVLAVVAASVLLGLWRGVVSELLSLVAWVVAFFAARAGAGAVADVLTSYVADPSLRYVAGFAVVFVSVLLVLAMLRLALRELLHAVGLGFADRILGAAFGVARGVLVVLVGVLLGGLTAMPRQPWWRQAVLAPPLEVAVLASRPWLPLELAKRIHY